MPSERSGPDAECSRLRNIDTEMLFASSIGHDYYVYNETLRCTMPKIGCIWKGGSKLRLVHFLMGLHTAKISKTIIYFMKNGFSVTALTYWIGQRTFSVTDHTCCVREMSFIDWCIKIVALLLSMWRYAGIYECVFYLIRYKAWVAFMGS